MRSWMKWALPAALILGACGGGGGGGSAGSTGEPADPDESWMDDALVEVKTDDCAGLETVALADAASGKQLVVEERYAPDAGACGAK